MAHAELWKKGGGRRFINNCPKKEHDLVKMHILSVVVPTTRIVLVLGKSKK
jgi:hypothetical protein